MTREDSLAHLTTLLSPSEVLHPGTPAYKDESTCWASQHDRHPALVIRPQTLSSLSSALAYLASTDLEIDARSQGFGSASAKDVLIALSAFDAFELDLENKTLILGAGQPWRRYYEKMEAEAPEWTGGLWFLLFFSLFLL